MEWNMEWNGIWNGTWNGIWNKKVLEHKHIHIF